MNSNNEPDRHCRRLAIHEPHDYQIPGAAWSSTVRRCPGNEHNHEKYCCREHGTHVSPHVGCILR
jgi:hypothetical protein